MNIIPEANYIELMKSKVEPALAAARTDGVLNGWDGNPLFYSVFKADAPRGTICIVHGYKESIEKYRELIYYFLQDGLNVCMLEQRGFGRSYRAPGVDKLSYVHVERFSEYIDDLDIFVNQIVKAQEAPYYLYSHSMGGAVCALYLAKVGDANPFKKTLLSSPMIGVKTGVPRGLMRVVVAPLALLTPKAKVPGSAEYPGFERFNPVADKNASEPRFQYYEDIKSSTPYLQSYTPTCSWGYQSLHVTPVIFSRRVIRAIRAQNDRVCICQASFDNVVDNKTMNRFAEKCGLPMMHIDAHHTIFRAIDLYAQQYLDKVLEYIH